MLTRRRRYGSDREQLPTSCRRSTGTTINPSDVVRDLGVLFDSELTMKKHIAKVAAVGFFHIRRLRQTRRSVGKDVTIRLVLALITPRLDYCNSVFASLPQSTLEPTTMMMMKCKASPDIPKITFKESVGGIGYLISVKY